MKPSFVDLSHLTRTQNLKTFPVVDQIVHRRCILSTKETKTF